MTLESSTEPALRAELAELRARLEEAEQTLHAIRAGEVDALVVEGDAGPQLFTLQGLDAEQNRFRGEMLAQVNDAVVTIDDQLRVIYANAAAERRYGLSANQMLGRPLMDLYQREWPRPGAQEEMMRKLAETGRWIGESVHTKLSGERIEVESSVTRMLGADGTSYVLLDVSRDITERKRVEEALRLSERRFRGIFDSALQFIGLMTPDGTLIEANRTALEGGGLCAKDVIGRPFWECNWWALSEQTGRELRTAIGRAASGELVRYDVDVQGPEGRIITIDFSIKPIRDETGRVVLLIPEGRDITGLKRAEENLRLTNDRFELAVRATTAVLWQQDLDLRFTWLYDPLQGFDGLDAVGKRDADLLEHAEDVAGIESLKREVIRSGVRMHQEFSPRLQGVVRCFDLLMEPLRDAAGLIIGITGAAIDITERKQLEEQKAEALRLLDTLLTRAPIGFLYLDREMRFMRINERLAEMNGLSIAEHLGRTVAEILPSLAPTLRDVTARILATGKPVLDQEFAGETARAPGVIRYWCESWYPVRDDHEEIIGFGGVVEDITERRNAEAALQANEERTRLATTATGVGIWEWNLLTGFVRWDAQMFRLYGVTPTSDGLVNYETWYRAILPEDRAHQKEVLAETVRQLGTSTRDFRIVRADNRECRWIQAVETVRANDKGKAEWVVGTNLDVTARTNAERAIREEAQRRDDFLAMMGHELRNPLNAIRHAVQIGAEAPDDRDACQWATQVIDRQSLQLSRMVDDLLDVARINRGRIELRVEALDLGPVLEQAIAVVRPLYSGRRQTFTSDIEGLLRVTGDAPRLEQVFVNLLTNAGKYTPDDGHISLRAWHEEDEVVVAITDNGAGISPELLPRIFDLFRQADSTLDRALGGLGIGLNVVRSLVEMHFGRVTVESAGTDSGSTATVRLPSLLSWPAVGEPPTAPSLDTSQTKPVRVLIVDDHIDAAETLELLLQLRGCEARCANSGPAGVTAAREFLPDVLLLDLGLPGFDGYEVARILRAEVPFGDALFIAISGYAQDSDRERCLASGFDYHLPKPFDVSALIQAIHSRPSSTPS